MPTSPPPSLHFLQYKNQRLYEPNDEYFRTHIVFVYIYGTSIVYNLHHQAAERVPPLFPNPLLPLTHTLTILNGPHRKSCHLYNLIRATVEGGRVVLLMDPRLFLEAVGSKHDKYSHDHFDVVLRALL